MFIKKERLFCLLRKKGFLFFFVFLIFFLGFLKISANTTGTIDSNHRYALTEKGEWLDFNYSESNIIVSDSDLKGRVFGNDSGWIYLNCLTAGNCNVSQYKVSNNGEGKLSGYAYGEKTGWINFNPEGGGIVIDSNGYFRGYAYGEKTGWISFNCSDVERCDLENYKVRTSWRPKFVREGRQAPTYSVSLSPHPAQGGTVQGSGSYNLGERVYISANPSQGYDFLYWLRNGTIITKERGYLFVINENENFTAVFEGKEGELKYFSIVVRKDNNLVAEIGFESKENLDWEEGSRLEWDEIRNRLGWQGARIDSDGSKSLVYFPNKEEAGIVDISLLIPSNQRTGIVYLCPQAETINNVYVGCPGIYLKETAIKNGFYEMDVNNGGGAEYIDEGEYIVSLEAFPSNSLILYGSGIYRPGERITIKAIPKEGYEFRYWREGDSIISGNQEYSFIIDKDKKFTAISERKDSPVIPIDPEERIVKVIERTIVRTTKTIETTTRTTRDFMESPLGKIITRVTTAVGAITGTSVIAANAIFTTPLSFSNLFLSFLRIWSLLLVAVGLKKKFRPWGTVYDSITKQPLDPVYVILEDLSGKEVASCISDIDGRYGFVVEPGKYILKAQKVNYEFPSKKIKEERTDGVYDNLYFGEEIEIRKKGEILAKNIPMDPLKFDWNEFNKKSKNRLRFYSKIDRFFSSILINFLFNLGFVISVAAYFTVPEPYNLVTLLLYISIWFLRKLGLKPRMGGYIIEKETGNPLSFAVLKIYLWESGDFFSQKVANKNGKYYCLLPVGDYHLTIEKKNSDSSYSQVFSSGKITAKKGVINDRFKI